MFNDTAVFVFRKHMCKFLKIVGYFHLQWRELFYLGIEYAIIYPNKAAFERSSTSLVHFWEKYYENTLLEVEIYDNHEYVKSGSGNLNGEFEMSDKEQKGYQKIQRSKTVRFAQ